MSKVAPWLALSIDWQDSEMFDDANHGVRLAWICLLCFAKAQGRAGKVRFRGKAFAENYRLSKEVVDELLARAGRAGAVVVDGDHITVVNWAAYQDPKARNRMPTKHQADKGVTSKNCQISKTSAPSTQHPPPSTQQEETNVSSSRQPSAADFEIADWMLLKIVAIAPNAMGLKLPQRPITLQKWADEIRLMRQQDGRSPADIRKVFEWANRDSFWRSNILSAGKLREKFDQLVLRMSERGGTKQDNSKVSSGSGERSL